MSRRVVVVPITPEGLVGPHFGRAPRLAVAAVEDGAISEWTEHQVDWDVLHDEGTEGGHHARIVRFVREHGITHVVAGHVGPPMQNTFAKLGIVLSLGASGDARAAVLAA